MTGRLVPAALGRAERVEPPCTQSYPEKVRTAWTLALGAVWGCAGNPGHDLNIDLRTDYVPAGEFASYVVTLGGQPSVLGVANASQDFVGGVRIAEFTKVRTGAYDVRVDLLDGAGVTVASRNVSVSISTDTTVTFVITRSCRGVTCPASGDPTTATSCLGGTCVDPECTPENPTRCPTPDCTSASDCAAPPQSCLAAQCVAGVCLYGDDGSCGADRYCDSRTGCVNRPTAGDGGLDGGRDAGIDATMDTAPDPCEGITCEGFEGCMGGSCVPYPGCFTDTDCVGELTICRNNHCVPGNRDIDGDGSPASDDCDETNPDISPLTDELCNLVDDDCDTMTDEGNPGLLCASDPLGGECIDGRCGCPDGKYDVDGVPDNGCECAATWDTTTGASCTAAIDVGTLSDTAMGERMIVTGNIVPDGREVWFRFRANDTPDSTCDNFHVAVNFVSNPDDAFRFNVFRGACDSAACPATGFTTFSWATDFRNPTPAPGTGECPCSTVSNPGTGGIAQPGRNACTDNSADFYVQVVRRAGAAVTCDAFELELSNGLYDT